MDFGGGSATPKSKINDNANWFGRCIHDFLLNIIDHIYMWHICYI
jgi:hypothetical protein